MAIHLDHNATTPLRPEARAAWLEALDAGLGNPSSLHTSGRRARQCIDEARERVAAALGVHEEEVLFTGGATEAIHLALAGHLGTLGPGAAFASAPTEHAAVRGAAERLVARGHPHRSLLIDREGELVPDTLERAAAAGGLALVALSAGNHEIGTAHDLPRAREVLGRGPGRPRLFVDGVQALGRRPLELECADMAAFSAHKLGGPLGVGVLFVRRGVPLGPILAGGGQERGLRPGTENAAALAAAAVAIELAVAERVETAARMAALTGSMWRSLAARVPGIELAGPPLERERRLPNTLCVLAPAGAADGRMLVARLDLEGLEVSAGSACASGSLEPSPVLLALGYEPDRARAALRLSVGATTTAEESQRAVDILVSVLVPSRARCSSDGPL